MTMLRIARLAALAAIISSGPAAAQQFTLKQPVDLDAAKTAFETMAAEMGVPAAAMLLRTPDGEIEVAYGVRGLDDPTPITIGDHIRVGSVTKTWTTTVVLQMIDEKKIALEDPVSKYRPDVPNGDNISIAQLLSMRSGLFNYTTTYELSEQMDNAPQRAWDPEELVAMARPIEPYFAPGEGFFYSNTNTVLLGLIAQAIDGKPLETIFQDRLFTPLGLADTTFPAISSNAMLEPHPRGYMYTDNLLTLFSTAIPADLQLAAKEGTLKPNDQTDANPSWAWAAGSGISNVRDLATFVEAMVEGGLLSPEMQEVRMSSLQPQAPGMPGAPLYGLGIAQFGSFYGHTGELPGFNTFMGRDPNADVTLIVWASLAPLPDGRGPAATLARGVIGELFTVQ